MPRRTAPKLAAFRAELGLDVQRRLNPEEAAASRRRGGLLVEEVGRLW